MKQTAFLDELQQSIPLTRAMAISACEYDGQTLQLSAPLAANVNDKGTGFAGSLTALATLAGWSLTTLYARDLGEEVNVVAAESHVRYLLPVTADFTAQVSLPDRSLCERFHERLQSRGKASLPLTIQIFQEAELALQLESVYVAIRR
jgi:thioesterase domain-containing protein